MRIKTTLFSIVLIMLLVTPAFAAEINPSVRNQPLFCQYKLTKDTFLCDQDQRGLQGVQGPQGEQGEQNFSLMAWNITNSTLNQNTTNAWNVSSSTFYSNYTYYGGTEINESYAYLPGRDGGQTLTGGTTTGDMVINGSMTGGVVVLQPVSGGVAIGTSTASGLLHMRRASALASATIASGSTYARWGIQGGNTGDVLWYIYSGYPSQGDFSFRDNTGGINALTIKKTTGYLGLGSSAPWSQFYTTGGVTFRNCSGTPTLDPGGNLTCASDPKLKTAVTTYTSDSAKVASVSPISYKWNTASGYDTTHINTGFDAAQIQQVYPECIIARDDVIYSQVCDKEDVCNTVEKKVGTQTLAIDDKCLIAVLFNSAKDQRTQITTLREENKKTNERLTALEKGVRL